MQFVLQHIPDAIFGITVVASIGIVIRFFLEEKN